MSTPVGTPPSTPPMSPSQNRTPNQPPALNRRSRVIRARFIEDSPQNFSFSLPNVQNSPTGRRAAYEPSPGEHAISPTCKTKKCLYLVTGMLSREFIEYHTDSKNLKRKYEKQLSMLDVAKMIRKRRDMPLLRVNAVVQSYDIKNSEALWRAKQWIANKFEDILQMNVHAPFSEHSRDVDVEYMFCFLETPGDCEMMARSSRIPLFTDSYVKAFLFGAHQSKIFYYLSSSKNFAEFDPRSGRLIRQINAAEIGSFYRVQRL